MSAVVRLARLRQQIVPEEHAPEREVQQQRATAPARGMVPLTERQLKDWIADGVLVIPISDFSDEFHLSLFDRAEQLHNHNQALMAPMYVPSTHTCTHCVHSRGPCQGLQL